MNFIGKIKDDRGNWRRGDESVESVFLTYFQDIFKSSVPVDEEDICEVAKGKLSEQHKNLCASNFTATEVYEAIFQMHPLKALGPDGLPAFFTRSIGT